MQIETENDFYMAITLLTQIPALLFYSAIPKGSGRCRSASCATRSVRWRKTAAAKLFTPPIFENKKETPQKQNFVYVLCFSRFALSLQPNQRHNETVSDKSHRSRFPLLQGMLGMLRGLPETSFRQDKRAAPRYSQAHLCQEPR